jgi:hypothetical protein
MQKKINNLKVLIEIHNTVHFYRNNTFCSFPFKIEITLASRIENNLKPKVLYICISYACAALPIFTFSLMVSFNCARIFYDNALRLFGNEENLLLKIKLIEITQNIILKNATSSKYLLLYKLFSILTDTLQVLSMVQQADFPIS